MLRGIGWGGQVTHTTHMIVPQFAIYPCCVSQACCVSFESVWVDVNEQRCLNLFV